MKPVTKIKNVSITIVTVLQLLPLLIQTSTTTVGNRVPDQEKVKFYNCTENCRHGYCQTKKRDQALILQLAQLSQKQKPTQDLPPLEQECICEENWSGRDCNACDGRRLITTNDGGFIRHGDRTLSHYKDDSTCSWLIQPDYLKNLNSSQAVKPIHLTIQEFSSECNWDYLWIYDGQSAQDKKLMTLRVGAFFFCF